MLKQQVAIIGSGITGLTCAWLLAKRGHKVHVFERSKSMGGLAASFHSDGFVFDYGPHEFCTNNPVLVDMLQELLGPDLLICHKKAAQYFHNSFLDYPAPITKIIARFNKRLLVRIVIEVLFQRLKRLVWDHSDYSFKHWVDSRFGPTLYQSYFGPYTQKVWGLNPDQLDSRTASSRIAFNSIFDFVIKTFQYFMRGQDDFATSHSPLKHSYYYSRGGIGTLLERLSQACREQDVQFYLEHEYRGITINDQHVESLLFSNGKSFCGFDQLVSTIPLSQLLRGMNAFPEDAMPLRFRAMVFVFLEVPRPQVSDFSWIYVPSSDICFQRITEFKHIDASMAPSNATGLCLEVACFTEDEVWRSSDENIVCAVRRGLAHMGLVAEHEACRAHVVRVPFAYPIQFAGFIEAVSQLLQPVHRLNNVISTGRQGLFKYCNMNECMEMAIEVAQNIDQGEKSWTQTVEARWRGAGLEEERTLA